MRPGGARTALGARAQDAVPALELGAVDGEVGLVDELVRVRSVSGKRCDAEGHRGSDRLARRLDREPFLGDRPANPLGDRESLLWRRLREDDRELLPAEPRRDVRMSQVPLEDGGDPVQDGVAGKVPVRVVDVAEQVEVGHDHRERRLGAARALELLPERACEVAGVEEPGLHVEPSLLLQRRHAQRAVHEDEGRDGHRQEERVPIPEPGEGDAEQGEHKVGREALHREEAGAAQRVPAREVQHRREEDVVQRDEDDRGHEAGERELEIRAQPRAPHQFHRPPRREPVERVVRDVERLDVPGVANLQPLRDSVDDAEERDQLGRKKQDARDEEDDRRVVALVTRRPDHEELCDRGARREDEERRPAARLQRQVGEGQRRGRRRECADDVEEGFGARRKGGRIRALGLRRQRLAGHVARDRAHRPLPGERTFAHGDARLGRRAMG